MCNAVRLSNVPTSATRVSVTFPAQRIFENAQPIIQKKYILNHPTRVLAWTATLWELNSASIQKHIQMPGAGCNC